MFSMEHTSKQTQQMKNKLPLSDREKRRAKYARNSAPIITDDRVDVEMKSRIRINYLRSHSHNNQVMLLMDKHPKQYTKDNVFFIDNDFMKKRLFELKLWDDMWSSALENKYNKILLVNLLSMAETLYKRSETLLNIDYFPFYPDMKDNMTSDEEDVPHLNMVIHHGHRSFLPEDHPLNKRKWISLMDYEKEQRDYKLNSNKYLADEIAKNKTRLKCAQIDLDRGLGGKGEGSNEENDDSDGVPDLVDSSDVKSMFRQQLEEEDRKARSAKKNDEEAEESDEEGQRGLGDFGFGTMSELREMDEEKNPLKLRRGDLDRIVDDVSDGEGDEEAAAKALEMKIAEDKQAAKALEMEIAEDKQRTKDVIFHIMEERRMQN